ncbi:uncharacterized protein [Physcomitrium patens]|uniref:uncharacterized protein isoform X3 n=1 Tax=Physcomitrium patens TaxID=3218 RepID=UPI003CCDB757
MLAKTRGETGTTRIRSCKDGLQGGRCTSTLPLLHCSHYSESDSWTKSETRPSTPKLNVAYSGNINTQST